MIIQELAAKLGLEIDEGAFAVGEQIIAGMSKGLIGIGVALGAYAGGMQALISSTATAAFAATKAGQAAGLSAEAWQELVESADDSGISAEQLQGGLRKLARAAYDASQGSQEATEAFAALGLSIYDAGGRLKAPDVLLQDLAASLEKMPEGMRKTALAQRVLGKSGAELLIWLNKGGDAIERGREEAHEFGTVLGTETLAAAEDYRLANDALSDSVRGLGYEIGGPLLKGAGDLAKAFAEFVKQNRKAIAATVRRPFELMRDAIKWITTNLWAAKLALVVFTSYMLVAYAPAIAAAVASAYAWAAGLTWVGVAAKAAGMASAAAGVLATGAWVAGLAIAILLAEDLYTFLQGGDSLIGRIGESWTKLLDEKLAAKPDDWGPIAFLKEWARYLFDLQKAIDKIGQAWQEFKNSLSVTGEVFDNLKALYRVGGIGEVGNALGDMWSPAASSPTASVANSSAGGAGTTVNAPQLSVTMQVQAAPGMDTKQLAQEATDSLADWFSNELQQSIPAVAPNS